MVVSIDYKFESYECGMYSSYLSICIEREWGECALCVAYTINKMDYAIVTNVQFIEMTKLLFFFEPLLDDASSLYTSSCVGTFLFFVSIVFNSLFHFLYVFSVILVIIILMRCFVSFTFFYPVEWCSTYKMERIKEKNSKSLILLELWLCVGHLFYVLRLHFVLM